MITYFYVIKINLTFFTNTIKLPNHSLENWYKDCLFRQCICLDTQMWSVFFHGVCLIHSVPKMNAGDQGLGLFQVIWKCSGDVCSVSCSPWDVVLWLHNKKCLLVTHKQALGLLLESSKQSPFLWCGEWVSEAFKDHLRNLRPWRHVAWEALCLWREFPHSSSQLLRPSSLAVIPSEQLVSRQEVPQQPGWGNPEEPDQRQTQREGLCLLLSSVFPNRKG